MDTRHLRNFLKVAELGSISRAAEALALSQPSLSQQMLRLEDEVGARLFDRTPRGVKITRAGELLATGGLAALKVLEGAQAEIRRAAAEDGRKVALGMPFSISRLLAVVLTERVMEEAAPIALRIHEAFSGAIRAMVLDGRLDLGLLYDIEPLDGLEVVRLAREDLYLVGPRGRLGGGDGPSVGLAELTATPLVVPGPAHGLRQALEREAARLGVRLSVASEIDTLEHIVGLVADGRGFSILPLAAMAGELRAGRISAAKVEGAFQRTLYLARSPDRPASAAVLRVEALVVALIAALIAGGTWAAEAEVGGVDAAP